MRADMTLTSRRYNATPRDAPPALRTHVAAQHYEPLFRSWLVLLTTQCIDAPGVYTNRPAKHSALSSRPSSR